MTSKTELKELILSLREEVRELKTEFEVMKTLICNTNANTVYPITGSSKPIKFTPYVPSKTPCELNPQYHNITICTTKTTSSDFTSYPEGTTESEV